MNRILPRLSWLVTVRPYLTLAVLVIITVVLAAGAGRRAPVVEGAALAFLPPPGNAVAYAITEIDDLFGDSGEFIVATLIFRGETLTPDGLARMDALIDGIVSDAGVGELLAPGDPVVAPSLRLKAVLRVTASNRSRRRTSTPPGAPPRRSRGRSRQ